MNIENKTMILETDTLNFLNEINFRDYKKFSIIFFDPPYKDKNFTNYFKFFKK